MRGTVVKRLRRLGVVVAGPGLDEAPGLGRAWRREQVRENRDDVLRARCVQFITGVEPKDQRHLDERFDWIRQAGSRRLLAHVHRLSADRAHRPPSYWKPPA